MSIIHDRTHDPTKPLKSAVNAEISERNDNSLSDLPGTHGQGRTVPNATESARDAFSGMFAFNLLVMALDFPRFSLVAVILAILFGLFFVLWLGAYFQLDLMKPIHWIFSGIYAVANKGFYIMVFVTLMLVFSVIYVTRWLDYWEILPNEILHHHGPLSDLERYPTMNLKFDKEIPDVLEWLLLGAGRLVLHVPNVSKALVLDNVLFISAKEKALKKRDEPSRSAGHDRPGSRGNGDLRPGNAAFARAMPRRGGFQPASSCAGAIRDAAPSGEMGFQKRLDIERRLS